MPEPVDNPFGSRLRELRERTPPARVGLPAGERRRVPGLRREELAAFSDLSVDYLTRLEQGHARSPSADVVAALGRAMKLPRAEAEHLHRLAGQAPPGDLDVPRDLTPGVHRLIERLGEAPIAAYDATWTLLAASPAWRRLHGEEMSMPGFNLLRAAFSDPPDPGDDPFRQEELRRSLVADLRISAARYPSDEGLRLLLGELSTDSPAFAATWSEGRAAPFSTEAKLIAHPILGEFWLDCDVLLAPEGDTRLVLYTAAQGSPGERALEALAKEGRDRPGALEDGTPAAAGLTPAGE